MYLVTKEEENLVSNMSQNNQRDPDRFHSKLSDICQKMSQGSHRREVSLDRRLLYLVLGK